MNAGVSQFVRYSVLAAVPVGAQIAALHGFGQPFVAASGRVRLWVNDPFRTIRSNWPTGTASSHIIHGFVFYGLLKLAAARAPVGVRFLVAMAVEVTWELMENTPAVIQHYRRQALAAGYAGDSIPNSVSDTAMMCVGFFMASRLKARYVVALVVGFEVFTAWAIRDNLTLNVINLLAPSQWPPIQAIHHWQAGGHASRR